MCGRVVTLDAAQGAGNEFSIQLVRLKPQRQALTNESRLGEARACAHVSGSKVFQTFKITYADNGTEKWMVCRKRDRHMPSQFSQAELSSAEGQR